jgi:flagellar basal body rod protein FlgC
MSVDLLAAAAAGMDAQRAALDVAARNVAAAEAAGPNGSYPRAVAEFSIVRTARGSMLRFAGARVERGTNVDVLAEMLAVMNASRAYESNAAVFDAGKSLAQRTIDLGRVTP